MHVITLNGRQHELRGKVTSVADLIRDLDLAGKRIAVEMNGDIVPRSRYADTLVAAGDKLEIVAAVGGG